MLLVSTSQLVVKKGPKRFRDKCIRDQKHLLFVAVDGVAAGVAGAVYPDE